MLHTTRPPGTLMPVASNWCQSVSENVKIVFEWTIHHLELRSLESISFSAEEVIEGHGGN